MDKPDERGFLSRWSRLKQGENSAEPAVASPVAPEPVTVLPVAAEETPPPPPLTDADLPDPDSLDVQSDFSGFLGEGISEALRRKALKKLFHLPEFNLRDGLNEYDEDFSTFEPLGETVTYQMKQWLERQKDDFQQALEEDPSEDGDEPVASLEPSEVQAGDEPLEEIDG